MEDRGRMESSESEQLLSHQTIRYVVAKRIIDIIFSFSLLLLLSPFLLLVSLALYVSDGKPIIFKQVRVGKNNRHFVIWKFRTLKYRKRESQQMEQFHNPQLWVNGVPDEYIHKSKMHDEVTPIGKFLRKYSIDEIPQLIQVLKGDMSIVGPRPEVPAITKYYNEKQLKRLLVKPGITGYAQIKGRSNMNHGQKIEYDLFYIKNCTFLLDMKIICKTIIYVLRADGAY